MHQWIGPAMVQIMTCGLLGAKPLSKPVLGYCSEILIKIQKFSFRKRHAKMLSAKWWPFCPGGDVLKPVILTVFSSSNNDRAICMMTFLFQCLCGIRVGYIFINYTNVWIQLLITCQNILASMFVCRFVCLSVSLSVLSSITRERCDIWSPKLVHIWNGSAVPVSNIDKEVGHGSRSPGKKIGQIFKLP